MVATVISGCLEVLFSRSKLPVARSFQISSAPPKRSAGFVRHLFWFVLIATPLRPVAERCKHSCVSDEASCAQAACAHSGAVKDAKSQAHRCVVLLCTSQKKASSAAVLCVRDAPPPSPAERPIGSHTQRRPRRRRPETLRAKPSTFTKGAGGRQRAAHIGAVPGYPREHKGLNQNRDI